MKPRCFVIMPISQPDGYVDDHFWHVYRLIHKEACKAAGFEPIRADEVSGVNVISLDVIQRLITHEMVLADCSSRNPNVLYELGIRHAARRPVVIVKDDLTREIFDIDSLRRVSYSSNLRPDQIQKAIKGITSALTETYKDHGKAGFYNSPFDLLGSSYLNYLDGIKIFPSRQEITGDNGFVEAISRAKSLDMLALSAEMAITVFKEAFTASMSRYNFMCRLIILDPRLENDSFYSPLVKAIGGISITKRSQALELINLVELIHIENAAQERIKIKILGNTPLFHNIWIARDGESPDGSVAHVSAYGYNTSNGGPALRVHGESKRLFQVINDEFEWVWSRLATSISNEELKSKLLQ